VRVAAAAVLNGIGDIVPMVEAGRKRPATPPILGEVPGYI
jgi:hypothetical protein